VISYLNACSDSENDPLTYALTVYKSGVLQTTANLNNFMSFDTNTKLLTITFTNSVNTGSYSVRVSCSDPYNTAAVSSFTLTANDNQNLVIGTAPSSMNFDFTTSSYTFNVNTIFSDPEGQPFTTALTN
jgi:hypothetical protein